MRFIMGVNPFDRQYFYSMTLKAEVKPSLSYKNICLKCWYEDKTVEKLKAIF